MTTRRVVLISICAAVGGFILGFVASFVVGLKTPDGTLLARAEGDLAVGAGILETLRDGKTTDATLLVEGDIDGALVMLQHLASKGSELSPKTYERIARIKRMREASGYRPDDPSVRTAVERALELSPPGK